MQGSIPSDKVPVYASKSISLSFYNEDKSELEITKSTDNFYFSIPRDTSINLPPFKQLKTTSSNVSSALNILILNGFLINKNNVSIHYHIKPNNRKLGYFAAIKFGSNPYLNSTYKLFDLWKIFCPKGKLSLFY